MTIPGHISRNDLADALLTIRLVELDAHRKLSEGERRDLVADTFTTWRPDYVRDVVEAIVEP